MLRWNVSKESECSKCYCKDREISLEWREHRRTTEVVFFGLLEDLEGSRIKSSNEIRDERQGNGDGDGKRKEERKRLVRVQSVRRDRDG